VEIVNIVPTPKNEVFSGEGCSKRDPSLLETGSLNSARDVISYYITIFDD